MRKSCLWGLLILFTLAVSFNAAAAAETPHDNSSNLTDPMELSAADKLQGTDPMESSANMTQAMDAEGVVLQTRNYTCGPAALATLLRKLGINTTENELAALAGTTEEGTTMQGLLEAAKAKGVNMTGMKLNITELHENMIAYTMSDGVGHYTLIREVNNETVKLADPTMGNIEMSLEGFQEIYTGYTLIINNTIDNTVELLENQNLENRTASDNQTGHEMNPMNISTDQPIQGTDSAKILSTEEMQKIIGKNWKYRLKKKGKWHGKEFNWWKVYYWAAVAGTVYGGPWGKAGALYLMFEPSEGRYYRTHCG